jgi:hypothetical protein
MPGLRTPCKGNVLHKKDLLREQALRLLLRGLPPKVDPKLAETSGANQNLPKGRITGSKNRWKRGKNSYSFVLSAFNLKAVF